MFTFNGLAPHATFKPNQSNGRYGGGGGGGRNRWVLDAGTTADYRLLTVVVSLVSAGSDGAAAAMVDALQLAGQDESVYCIGSL